MKKICFVLAMLLMIMTVSVYAEGIDLSEMSDDEIRSLIEQARDELFGRGVLRSGTLLKGGYVAGQDIAVGTYTVSKPEGEYALSYIVLNDINDYQNYDMWDMSKDYGDLENVFGDSKGRVVLKDGNVLYIINGSMYLEEENLGLLAP